MTAAIGLYSRLHLPNPWEAATAPIPLIVYGASGAVGSYAIKLARASNIHPIIAIAGKGQTYVETLIDRHRGDTIVDYRNGDENVVERIKDALKKAGQDTVSYAFDTISEKGSYQNIIKILKDGGHITLVLPEKDYSDIPKKFTHSVTYVGSAHLDVEEDSWLKEQAKQGIRTGGKHFALVYFRLFGQALQEGWLKGHPYEVVPGGLDGVQTALSNLVAGKASAVKYIFKIADTAGTGSGS
jgi:NADPH2:quinone reductase